MIENLREWLNAHGLELDQFFLFVTPIVSAVIILTAGWLIAKFSRRWVRTRKFSRLNPSTASTMRPVLASVVGYVVFLAAIYAALRSLNIDSAPLLAAFGGAALAIGLALQGTLSNIASGVMMLFLQPLRVGEYVDTTTVVGTVDEIGLFQTTFKNIEGVFVFVPNSEVWKNRIQNFARHTERKLIMDIGVAYDTDLEAARDLIIATMAADTRVLDFPTLPECHVMSFGDSAINLSARCMMGPADWLKNTSDIRIKVKQALDQANIEIPFPQRVVHQAKS
ncbi:mechanosensitive ion channel family protein [Robiginitomaculum antarcticum]|uniref:mechanosensitive ion channel family protein n=1 Tax=Robiginitomaculum antarcticum TaxID=437507 RepID=UPI000377FAA0|nr:mechanosensitive ion channel family protein [Robiginitomaculum antarcticum]